jgi:hypothetical protein
MATTRNRAAYAFVLGAADPRLPRRRCVAPRGWSNGLAPLPCEPSADFGGSPYCARVPYLGGVLALGFAVGGRTGGSSDIGFHRGPA